MSYSVTSLTKSFSQHIITPLVFPESRIAQLVNLVFCVPIVASGIKYCFSWIEQSTTLTSAEKAAIFLKIDSQNIEEAFTLLKGKDDLQLWKKLIAASLSLEMDNNLSILDFIKEAPLNLQQQLHFYLAQALNLLDDTISIDPILQADFESIKKINSQKNKKPSDQIKTLLYQDWKYQNLNNYSQKEIQKTIDKIASNSTKTQEADFNQLKIQVKNLIKTLEVEFAFYAEMLKSASNHELKTKLKEKQKKTTELKECLKTYLNQFKEKKDLESALNWNSIKENILSDLNRKQKTISNLLEEAINIANNLPGNQLKEKAECYGLIISHISDPKSDLLKKLNTENFLLELSQNKDVPFVDKLNCLEKISTTLHDNILLLKTLEQDLENYMEQTKLPVPEVFIRLVKTIPGWNLSNGILTTIANFLPDNQLSLQDHIQNLCSLIDFPKDRLPLNLLDAIYFNFQNITISDTFNNLNVRTKISLYQKMHHAALDDTLKKEFLRTSFDLAKSLPDDLPFQSKSLTFTSSSCCFSTFKLKVEILKEILEQVKDNQLYDSCIEEVEKMIDFTTVYEGLKISEKIAEGIASNKTGYISNKPWIFQMPEELKAKNTLTLEEQVNCAEVLLKISKKTYAYRAKKLIPEFILATVQRTLVFPESIFLPDSEQIKINKKIDSVIRLIRLEDNQDSLTILTRRLLEFVQKNHKKNPEEEHRNRCILLKTLGYAIKEISFTLKQKKNEGFKEDNHAALLLPLLTKMAELIEESCTKGLLGEVKESIKLFQEIFQGSLPLPRKIADNLFNFLDNRLKQEPLFFNESIKLKAEVISMLAKDDAMHLIKREMCYLKQLPFKEALYSVSTFLPICPFADDEIKLIISTFLNENKELFLMPEMLEEKALFGKEYINLLTLFLNKDNHGDAIEQRTAFIKDLFKPVVDLMKPGFKKQHYLALFLSEAFKIDEKENDSLVANIKKCEDFLKAQALKVKIFGVGILWIAARLLTSTSLLGRIRKAFN